MNVRRLTAANVPEYRALMLHAYEHAADAFTSTPEERATAPDAWWAQRIADPAGGSAALGAFADGALIGTVALEFSSKPKTRHKALLIGMFVMAHHRGRGAGRKLVDAALALAREHGGVRAVVLTVTQGNDEAVSLYERSGFTAFGVEPMAILTPGGFRSKVHMWREIGEA